MDKQARGLLLVEKEETEEKIERLREQLHFLGTKLSSIGQAVAIMPERVFFANAPGTLGARTMRPTRDNFPIPWDEIPDKVTIAKLIQELEKTMDRLQQIDLELR